MISTATPEILNQLDVQILTALDKIDADEWDAMVEGNNPFVKHAFLHALEKHNCLGSKWGWLPQHLAVFHQDKLLAALPLYEKHNNYGEFVFDQAWQQAWEQIGLPYYPKLVTASPYSPIMGQRFLIHPELPAEVRKPLFKLLLDTATERCEQQNMSGFHILFAEPTQQDELGQVNDQHLYRRQGCQFHWQNQAYQGFNDFLAQLKSKKRNNIIRERTSINEAGITFRQLEGGQTTEQDWRDFDYFYQKTFLEKWSPPTLNLPFFLEISKTMAEQLVLVLADKDGECIAGALMFKSDTHLYGRHWGCKEEVKNLHFETCFYQGIEYAISHGLQVFEPGAGGEHKIARGFTPVMMDSFHWLPLNPFGENLDRFIDAEAEAVNEYHDHCQQHSPYRVSNR